MKLRGDWFWVFGDGVKFSQIVSPKKFSPMNTGGPGVPVAPTHPQDSRDLQMNTIRRGPCRFLEGLRLQACLMGRHNL